MSENFKCPYCEKSYPMKHLLVNHIRQSSGDHGKKYSFPADYKEKIKNGNVESNNTKMEVKESSPEVGENPNVEGGNETVNTEIHKVDPPEIPIVKTSKCPDCGNDKANWITTREAHNHEITLSYKEIEEFDYVCPQCNELIKTH